MGSGKKTLGKLLFIVGALGFGLGCWAAFSTAEAEYLGIVFPSLLLLLFGSVLVLDQTDAKVRGRSLGVVLILLGAGLSLGWISVLLDVQLGAFADALSLSTLLAGVAFSTAGVLMASGRIALEPTPAQATVSPIAEPVADGNVVLPAVMGRRIGAHTAWAVVALIGWLLPWSTFTRMNGETAIMWGYDVRTGFQDGVFIPGLLVPVSLAACLIVAIWFSLQPSSRTARSADAAATAFAGIVAVAQGAISFVVALEGSPISAGIGAYVLIVSGLALLVCALLTGRRKALDSIGSSGSSAVP